MERLSTTLQNKVIITLAVIPACFWPESRYCFLDTGLNLAGMTN